MLSKLLLIVFGFILFSFASIFSQNITMQLDEVKKLYSQKEYEKAIQLLDQIKQQINQEQTKKPEISYLPISNWDTVKIAPETYRGKKIKITTTFWGVNSGGNVTIPDIGYSNTFNKEISDKILKLKGYIKYTFYGEVKSSPLGPYLHIENVE